MDERGDADAAARAARGVVDVDSGLEAAHRALLQLRHTAFEVMRTRPAAITTRRMVLQGLLARAEAFHQAAMRTIGDGNPFATFTLIRSYAENAAVLVWLQDRPGRIDLIDPVHPNLQDLSVGKIVNAAGRRLGGFKPIYDQLSAFAHPAGSVLLYSWQPRGEDDGQVEWASTPRFKRSEDAEVACFWLIELAEANAHLWAECYDLYPPGPSSADLLAPPRDPESS